VYSLHACYNELFVTIHVDDILNTNATDSSLSLLINSLINILILARTLYRLFYVQHSLAYFNSLAPRNEDAGN